MLAWNEWKTENGRRNQADGKSMRILLVLTLVLGSLRAAGAADVVLTRESREPPDPLALTIYGDGWGLVWDRRAAALDAGANRLAFEEVSRQMLPSSAMIDAEAGVRLVEVSYDFALLTPDALRRRAIGRTVGVGRINPASGERIVENGTLLAIEDGVLVRIGDRILPVDPADLVFYDVPADLRPRPTLLATVDSTAAGRKPVRLGYLTRGLGWSADYVALWNEEAGKLDLTGRAAIANTSGADFPDATVALVAGTVHRAPEPADRMPMARAAPAPMMAEAKSMPARQEFADLHLYQVPGRISLADQQTRQITLLTLPGVAVRREYVSEADVTAYRQTGEPRPTHPQVRLGFDNKGPGGEAAPLPAGVVRVFASDGAGPPRLVGEDRIGQMPAGAKVELSPGEAFDLTVLRRQSDFKTAGLPQNVSESAWLITVQNARAKEATVRIVEDIPGDWTVLAESAAHDKEAAGRLVWRLSVPGRGSAQLTYRVRVQP